MRRGERIRATELSAVAVRVMHEALDAIASESDEATVLGGLDFAPRCGVGLGRVFTLWGFRLFASRPRSCGEPASHLVVCRGCGDSGLCCVVHRFEVLLAEQVQCSVCGASGLPERVYGFVLAGGA
jgi:hypothetical protein